MRRTLAITIVFLAAGAMTFALYRVVTPGMGDAPEFSALEKQAQVSLRVPEPAIPDAPVVRADRPVATMSSPQANVASDAADLPKALPDPGCRGNTVDLYRCYNPYYKALTRDRGIPAAMADLKARYVANDAFVVSQCHQLTHVIGRVAADLYPSAGEAFSHGDPFCWSGYYHGVMEGLLAQMGDGVTANLNTVCDTIEGKAVYSFDYYNCVHGLGHGLMYVRSNELFQSLELCDILNGQWERSSCYGGAFMENIIADEVNHFAKYLKNEDPLYPCDAVADSYKSACWLMHTSHMLKAVGGDFTKVFELCSAVEEPHTNTCYQSLGRDASGRSVSNVEQTTQWCLLGNDERQRSNCIIGAVKDFISYHHSDIEARALCRALPENFQSVCYQTTEAYYRYF